MDKEAIGRAVDKARVALRLASTPAEREEIRARLRALQQSTRAERGPVDILDCPADPPASPEWAREALAKADSQAVEDWAAWQRGERLPIQGALLRGGE